MMRMSALSSSGKPIFTAPLTCPLFPGFTVPSAATTDALAASPVSLRILRAQAHAPAAPGDAACLNPISTRANRGPPDLSIG
jgi:hypothetical protein